MRYATERAIGKHQVNEEAKQPVASSWPWRGLMAASLLALASHIAVFSLSQQSFDFRLPSPDNIAALTTRMIEPAPSALPPATPQAQPLTQPKPAPAKPALASARVPDELIAPAAPDKPMESSKLELNQPKASVDTAQSTTETVASVMPATPTAPQIPSDLIQPAEASVSALGPPGLKLAYPASANLQFDATVLRKGVSVSGSGVLSWRVDGTSYELTLQATALLVSLLTESSTGLLSPQGLEPQIYTSKRVGRSEQATHFRRAGKKIQFSNNKPDAVLLPGAQDRVSVLVQLAGILGGDPENDKAGRRIQMQVAGLDNAELWEFIIEEGSGAATPAGAPQAIKLSRTPRSEFDQRLEIWLAPQLGYLPVRIRQSSAATPELDAIDLRLRPPP